MTPHRIEIMAELVHRSAAVLRQVVACPGQGLRTLRGATGVVHLGL
jgi:hypothetical protein